MTTPQVGSSQYYMTESPTIQVHLASTKGSRSEESIRNRIESALSQIPEKERAGAIYATRSCDPSEAVDILEKRVFTVRKQEQEAYEKYLRNQDRLEAETVEKYHQERVLATLSELEVASGLVKAWYPTSSDFDSNIKRE